MTVRPQLSYRFVPGEEFTPELAACCSELFGQHYGFWEISPDLGSRSGKPVHFPPSKLEALVQIPNGSALLAYDDEALVGYATGVHLESAAGTLSWVTQLVVHTEYRNRKIASTLLGSAWSFSDHYGWGITSANPLAIRALEAATRRRCEPSIIKSGLDNLKDALSGAPEYLKVATLKVNSEGALADTGFPVSHAEVPERLNLAQREHRWQLGPLLPAHEWLGVTFKSQPRTPLTLGEFELLEEASGGIVSEAYERMALGAADGSHPWMAHTSHEVEVLLAHLGLAPGASILDLGCGAGRHAVALAQLGYRVTAVDQSKAWLELGRCAAEEAGVTVNFVRGDARSLDLGEKFDAALCLYDVVGSYPADSDNVAVADTLARHLMPGAPFALSVMNRHVADALNATRQVVADNPDVLLSIPPSSVMESTGNIWSGSLMLSDPSTGLFYRRERFICGNQLPTEFIVRDRRYYGAEIVALCREAQLEIVDMRPVRLGGWSSPLSLSDTAAKEILCLGKRS